MAPTYTVIAKAVVSQSPLVTSDTDPGTPGASFSYPAPSSPAATAVLPDGSFFVACWIEDWVVHAGDTDLGVLRLWRLSSALTVLGTVDIPHPHEDPYGRIVPYAVTTTGMNVLLLASIVVGGDGTAVRTAWAVDCSAETPVPGPEVPTPNAEGWQSYYALYSLYDGATDRVVLASGGPLLQVFQGATGELLWQADATATESSFEYPIGVAMDPADHTKFAVGGGDGDFTYLFTAALDGASGSYDGKTVVVTPPSLAYGFSWPLAAGSPYLAGGPAILDEEWDDVSDNNGIFKVFDAAGALVASYTESPDAGVNAIGGSATLGAGRHLITLYETYFRDVAYGAPGGFGARLVTVDQLATPPVVEVLDLPYFDLPPTGSGVNAGQTVSFTDRVGSAATSQGLGLVLVSATVQTKAGSYPDNVFMNTLMLWAIQGPSDKPNLTGQLTGVEVRFT